MLTLSQLRDKPDGTAVNNIMAYVKNASKGAKQNNGRWEHNLQLVDDNEHTMWALFDLGSKKVPLVRGNQVLITQATMDSYPNPHKPGEMSRKMLVSRFEIHTATEPTTEMDKFEQKQKQKTESIERQCAAKCASWLVAAGKVTFDARFKEANQWVYYFNNGGNPDDIPQPDPQITGDDIPY